MCSNQTDVLGVVRSRASVNILQMILVEDSACVISLITTWFSKALRVFGPHVFPKKLEILGPNLRSYDDKLVYKGTTE
jgi:hypothetical protein